jgi:uncharacterized membrane protein
MLVLCDLLWFLLLSNKLFEGILQAHLPRYRVIAALAYLAIAYAISVGVKPDDYGATALWACAVSLLSYGVFSAVTVNTRPRWTRAIAFEETLAGAVVCTVSALYSAWTQNADMGTNDIIVISCFIVLIAIVQSRKPRHHPVLPAIRYVGIDAVALQITLNKNVYSCQIMPDGNKMVCESFRRRSGHGDHLKEAVLDWAGKATYKTVTQSDNGQDIGDHVGWPMLVANTSTYARLTVTNDT